MLSNTLPMNEIPVTPETYGAGGSATGLCGQSRTERGQSFADSLPLAEAKAELDSDTEVQAGENGSVGSQSEEVDAPAAPEETVARKEAVSASAGRNRRSEKTATAHGSRPESETVTVERASVLCADQLQGVVEVIPPQSQGQSLVGTDGQVDSVQMCQVGEVASVQSLAAQLVGSESAQVGQLSSESMAVTVPVMPADTTGAPSGTSTAGAVPQAVKTTENQLPTLNADATTTSTTVQQTQTVESGTVESAAAQSTESQAALATPVPSEVSGRSDAVSGNQQPVHESREAPQAQTDSQMETEAQFEPDQGDAPEASVQAETPAPRRNSTEASSVSWAGKNDAPGVQNGSESQPGLSAIGSDVAVTTASRDSSQAVASSAHETATLKSPSQDLTEQLGSALRAGLERSDKQLTIHLQPPELGHVMVRLEAQGQEVKAVLEVSRPETGREIEQTLPQLIKTLQESGLTIRKFDVVVSDQLGKDAGAGTSAQDTWNQQQAWSGSESRQDAAARSAWSAWNGHQQTQSDTSRAHNSRDVTSRGGIDLLV